MPKGASADEIAEHAGKRAFYDMTGADNIYKYITTEGKRTGKRTALEYLQKNTGVFNGSGMLSEQTVKEMKAQLKENKGHIFHGFISLNEEQSYKIDTPEKCIELIRRTFPQFLADAKFHKDNVDLMCALHLDRPHHLHIHFVFWEKEPKYKSKDGTPRYRRHGKIDKKSIDNMFVRLGLYLSDSKDKVYKSRDKALAELKELLGVRAVMASDEQIKKEIISLAKDLPKSGRITYGSKDMESFRPRIDRIVQLLIGSDVKAMKANRRFYEAVAEREREVKNICGERTVPSSKGKSETVERDLPKYGNKIDESNIHVIEELKADYKRRQGNLVLNLCKFIKPEFFEYKRRHKPNDTKLKRSLGMSRNKINRACRKFFRSFGNESELLERDFTRRLQEIEEEIERERKKNQSSSGGNGSGETK
ncbi:relaxase MobL [Pumilibacter intestinalis]|uniref:relaxase MobL n=1 Tax=Pumilibacter intestinalis TaxID=2941511 RepID=UPI0020404522|nr:relaxase MobL [Pumilibacter intestinalis]